MGATKVLTLCNTDRTMIRIDSVPLQLIMRRRTYLWATVHFNPSLINSVSDSEDVVNGIAIDYRAC